MRLTCPNCGAQYEVPDEVIPEKGRDVQCSNCGDTWFQHHADHMPEIEDAEIVESEWDAEDEAQESAPEDSEAQPDDTDAEETPQDAAPQRRELDPAVADVLREEAERETAARAAEAQTGLETQPDLGLEDGASDFEVREAEAQARMARLRGEDETTAEATDAEPDPGTRRNLLPDIDEINSSLSSDATDPGTVQPGDSDDMDVAPRKGGFKSGFRMMIILAVLGLILYLLAPLISQTVPALEGVMTGFVSVVDSLRGWLDQIVGGLTGGAEAVPTEGGEG